MYIVICEFTLKDKARDRYVEIVTQMREELEKQPGFISIDRFENLNDSAQGVSISSWESDEAIKSWNKILRQRETSKEDLYETFRWRAAEVVFDYGPENK